MPIQLNDESSIFQEEIYSVAMMLLRVTEPVFPLDQIRKVGGSLTEFILNVG
jgi:hypothetical protein